MKRLIVFNPYWNPNKPEFVESLSKQTAGYTLIERDRKWLGISPTKACNDFREEMIEKAWFGYISLKDVVCILNNDISFGSNFFKEALNIKPGEVYIPNGEGVEIDWSKKSFKRNKGRIDTFPFTTVFITVEDFIKNKGFSKWLPYYLNDYEYAIRVIKNGIKPIEMTQGIGHKPHPLNTNKFSRLCPANPINWTFFLLLAGRNRYFFLNLLKAWMIWK